MNERITINNDISVWATLKKPVNVFLIHMKKDNTKATFPYYDSIYNCSRGITKLGSTELKTAVGCILRDATCAMLGYDDYLSEYQGTRKFYDGCKKSLDKVLTLMSKDDIRKVLESL